MTDFGETTWPSAAKEHRCAWCAEMILKGEKHAHYVGKWEGEFQDWRMHSECLSFSEDEIADGFELYANERPKVAALASRGSAAAPRDETSSKVGN